MNLLELGWLCGVVEGEGSIMISFPKDRACRVTVSVEMTDKDVIDKLQQVTGVGHVTTNKSRNPKWKPTWSWRVQSKVDALELIKTIRPYMGVRRSEQIDKVLTLNSCGQT